MRRVSSVAKRRAIWVLLLALVLGLGGFALYRNKVLPTTAKRPPKIRLSDSGAPEIPLRPRHVVLFVIDTLRADAQNLSQTPSIDDFSRVSRSPKVAWASGTWTGPSIISMFTGATVREHGWDFPFPRFMDAERESYPPVPDRPVLAEVLKQAGFETNGFVNNPLLRPGLGFERGFDGWERTRDGKIPLKLRKLVESWPEVGSQSGKPQFVYLHMIGPHHPLKPTPSASRRWRLDRTLFQQRRGFRIETAQQGDAYTKDQYRRAYLAVVEDKDRLVGRVMSALGPHLNETMVILTSDHGELLGEHDEVGHEQFVFEPLTRIPMFVRGGSIELPQVMTNALIPDLITRTVGVEYQWPESLDSPGPLVSQRQGKLALSTDGHLKGIWDDEKIPAGFLPFDINLDPSEKSPIHDRPFPFRQSRLMMERIGWEARVPHTKIPPAAAGMGAELMDSLRALGYMTDGEAGAGTGGGQQDTGETTP